jgi:hypothetical protein
MIGAGEGNRTLVISLEGCCSTIELHPHCALYLSRFGGHRSRTLPSALAPGLHRLRKAAMPEGRENQLVAQTGRPDLTLPCIRSHSCSLGQIGHVRSPSRLRPALRVPLTAHHRALPGSHSRPISAVLQATATRVIAFSQLGEGHRRCLASKAHRPPESCHGFAWPSKFQAGGRFSWRGDGRARSIGSVVVLNASDQISA